MCAIGQRRSPDRTRLASISVRTMDSVRRERRRMPDGHAIDERSDHLVARREHPDLAAASPTTGFGGPVPATIAGDARLSMRGSATPILATLQRHAGNRAVVERLGVQRIPDDTPDGAPADVAPAPAGDTTATGDGAGGGNQVISGETVEINASNIILNAGQTRVHGLLQSDTLVTDTVIASTYTPGAGNLW
jgi:hypothetical protein